MTSDSRPGDLTRGEFETRLSPYGRWVRTPEYGMVWVPGGVAADWRPYHYGHWVYTDWGWTWVSDEPFGYWTFHYGRWWWGAGVGWYWIPGRRWGPAWVSWRWSGGYVAWAPMVPHGRVLWGYRSPYWVTVQQAHFTQPIRTVAISPARQVSILQGTHALSGVSARPMQGSFGPPAASIARATGQAIHPTAVGSVVPGAVARSQAIARAPSGNARAGATAGNARAGAPTGHARAGAPTGHARAGAPTGNAPARAGRPSGPRGPARAGPGVRRGGRGRRR
jgi:hypothetical protein